jgi:hypothetical protein
LCLEKEDPNYSEMILLRTCIVATLLGTGDKKTYKLLMLSLPEEFIVLIEETDPIYPYVRMDICIYGYVHTYIDIYACICMYEVNNIVNIYQVPNNPDFMKALKGLKSTWQV